MNLKLGEDQLKIMCQTILKDHPNKDVDFYKMFLSTEVLRLLVDNQWVNETIFNKKPKGSGNKEASKFLRSSTNGFQWQERVFQLAERIYNLQPVKNFSNIIHEIINGNLVSRYAELEVGRHLKCRNISFEYVLPSGVKTKDYDIRITEKIVVNCEIKHKLETTELAENTISKTLSEANKQLPEDASAIIFLKIPQEWTENPEAKQILEKTFNSFFQRNKSKILGIMTRWEEKVIQSKGVFYWKYYFHKNPYHESKPIIEEFLKKLNGNPMDKHWTSFSDVISKCMVSDKDAK